MPHVATMGTSSCATISIGGFVNARQDNETYKLKGTVPDSYGMTIDQFYRDILYPVEQPLGRSRDYPFQKLMEEIDSGPLSSKLIMATLNAYQYQEKDRYWHHELKAHNFKLIAKTSNSIGTINYVYMRNPNEVEIEDAEA